MAEIIPHPRMVASAEALVAAAHGRIIESVLAGRQTLPQALQHEVDTTVVPVWRRLLSPDDWHRALDLFCYTLDLQDRIRRATGRHEPPVVVQVASEAKKPISKAPKVASGFQWIRRWADYIGRYITARLLYSLLRR